MSVRTTLTRLGITAAATALATTALAAAPALASPADDDPGGNNSSWGQQQNNNDGGGQQQNNSDNNDGGGNQQSSNNWNQQNSNQNSNDWGQHNNTNNNVGPYQGIVTANGGLRLRSAPNRGSAIIRVVPQGSIVNIFCKTGGENVDGNSLWYLLTDGTWAWGAARYIDNIGAAPRFC